MRYVQIVSGGSVCRNRVPAEEVIKDYCRRGSNTYVTKRKARTKCERPDKPIDLLVTYPKIHSVKQAVYFYSSCV